ncbi:putative bifunctional diguanylate cyclase/phosphodiesterase [Phyllobacterium leguminum]|uniref:Diguanylate cyclase/phosphodiesterase n=1 Tax=Phyllobacterium leguminum TaxID=314237 RepID=A0A318TDA4_9HYPH|nr:EAL domain-containing protein [Phyllobacterium leguminum]PYE86298.1 diguanylate cyclase/phosphodiesterase [Phyllobacterium leguminum]
MAWGRRTDIPADIRLSFVRSLYGNRATLWFGMLAHVVACAAIYLKTGNDAFIVFAVIFTFIALARLFDMGRFDRALLSSPSHVQINRWEFRYLIGAAAVCTALGMMCFYSTYVVRDSFAELASLSILLASVVSIVGRNYASRSAVIVMSVCSLVPVLAGFVLAGSAFHMIIGFLLIPYFLSNIQMANGLREFLFAAVMRRRELAVVAGRFDAALNNMPQGLIMFDGEGKLVVVNNEAVSLLKISPGTDLAGRSLQTVLRYSSLHGLFPRSKLKNIRRLIDDLLSGRRERDLFQFSDGRYIEFSCNQRQDAGAVLIFEDVTHRVEAEAQIQHMARYDGLTGLPNRVHFESLVKSLIARRAHGRRMALVVLDINDFKHVNDTLGHHVGDQLLRKLAERLAEMDPMRFIPSRFGGDEFVIFVPDAGSEIQIDSVMDHLLSAVSGTYQLSDHSVEVDVNAGVALAPAAQFDLQSLHIMADLALYEAKGSEGRNWAMFEEAMDIRYRSRQRLKNDLRGAIASGSLKVVYQPIVSAQSLRIVSCEALSRWDHPHLGPISPADYIPLAEEMGIITEITRFMLEKACIDCRDWGGRIGVSVNLSAIDLKNSDITDIIAVALRNSGLPTNLLEVEVTESAIISDRNKTSIVLQQLKNAGINVALDDFGTGYSSLSYLNTLPLTKVKMDRSFVCDITEDRRSLMLLRGVTQLSHEMGLGVTVEGVETQEQLALIRGAAGADLVQGYLLGAPMPAQAISALIDKSFPLKQSAQRQAAL